MRVLLLARLSVGEHRPSVILGVHDAAAATNLLDFRQKALLVGHLLVGDQVHLLSRLLTNRCLLVLQRLQMPQILKVNLGYMAEVAAVAGHGLAAKPIGC